MGPRPAHLNLNNDRSRSPQPPKMPFHLNLPSPRPGEVPPALSPLDAFAMHSRILAKQFEDEAQKGRRISRLPPLAVQKEMASRPDYFRNISGGSDVSGLGELPHVQEETSPTVKSGLMVNDGGPDRPISHYPMLGNMANAAPARDKPTPFYDAPESQQNDYFALPRSTSPESVDPRLHVEEASPVMPSLSNSIDSVQSASQPRTLTNGSTHSQRSLRSERGLAPPRSPAAFPKSPRSFQSIRSVQQDSADEDGASSYNGSHALSRQFSGGSSNMSRPQSPFSPYPVSIRSPSVTSEEYSVHGTQQTKRARATNYNFSRPLSSDRLSRPSMDSRPSLDARTSTELPHRHTSEASNTTYPSYSTMSSRQNSQDDVKSTISRAPVETPGEAEAAGGDYFSHTSAPNAAPSYIYSKYSLPRGRTVERNSIGKRESWLQHQFTWEEKKPPAEEKPAVEKQPPPPVLKDPIVAPPVFRNIPRTASPAGSERISGSRLSSRPVARDGTATMRSKSAGPVPEKPSLHRPSPSVQTGGTDRTIRAVPLHEHAHSAELTSEEHLEIGIQAHSAGHLNKSTYHLRLAAMAGLSTGMLLYALACRHGWGMRPNQEEGVMWLKKAIDGSGLEVVDVEETVSHASRSPKVDPAAEAAERRKRKAQFALAIYELGISYMNGWGCPKDKSLAVRCYEVAGNWGDCDALAEAGFCYTQGVGCKKDLKKAAMMYRRAAEGGMSMAGNSW